MECLNLLFMVPKHASTLCSYDLFEYIDAYMHCVCIQFNQKSLHSTN